MQLPDIALFVLLSLLVVWGAWKCDRALFAKNRKDQKTREPDLVHAPWEAVLSPEEIEDACSDPYPVCINCMHPESAPVWFCHKCGNPTGPYSAYMPYIKIFWSGWLLRSGVDGSVKLNAFRIIGFVLSSIISLGVFAPAYLFRLVQYARGKPLIQKKELPYFPEESEAHDQTES